MSFESWAWLHINDKKTETEPHHVLVAIEEVSLERDVKELIRQCISFLRDNRDKYEEVFLEKVSFHRGCGEFETKEYLVGKRLETNLEFNLRLEENKKQEQEKNLAQEKEAKAKEDKEKLEYLKLKAKFEGVR